MTMHQSVRVRFAPSPTGELHLGGARTALYNYLFAKKTDGSFVLRIEDTDQSRYVPGAMDRFFEDLKWLGFIWNEGPDVGGPYAPYIQSERTEKYLVAAKELVEKGAAYYCWCTPERLETMRQMQMAEKQPPKYDRHCFNLSTEEKAGLADQAHVVRQLIPAGITKFTDSIRGDVTIDNTTLDDQVLLKSDGFPTYHLAVIVDDHEMQITHTIRAEEWLPSTAKHILLYEAFGWQTPQFAHIPMILNQQKQKLSKRRDGEAVWIATYRKNGYLPEAMVNYLAFLGWNPGDEREFFTLSELTQEFSLERVHKAGAIFDPAKLRFINAHYLRQKSADELTNLLRDDGFIPEGVKDETELQKWIAITKDRMEILADFPKLVTPLLADLTYDAQKLVFRKSTTETTTFGLISARQALEQLSDDAWSDQTLLQQTLERVVTEKNLTNGDVFWPVRVALSGMDASPAPVDLLWVLGKEKALQRITAAEGLLKL